MVQAYGSKLCAGSPSFERNVPAWKSRLTAQALLVANEY